MEFMHRQGYFFHVFFLVGLGSVAFLRFYCWCRFSSSPPKRHLRALTSKSAMAALLGLSLPYWLLLPVFLFAREWLAPYLAIWDFSQLTTLPDFSHVPLSQWVGSGLFFFISVVSLVHFLRTAYNDKIRTRQYYYLLLLQVLPLALIHFALPQHFNTTLPLCLVTLAPFVGHYFALARGRGMNVWFILWVLLFLLLGIANYLDLWTLLSTF